MLWQNMFGLHATFQDIDKAIALSNTMTDNFDLLFFQVDISSSITKSLEDQIKSHIGGKIELPDDKKTWHAQDRVFFGNHNDNLSEAISFYLERQLVANLIEIYQLLLFSTNSNRQVIGVNEAYDAANLERQLRILLMDFSDENVDSKQEELEVTPGDEKFTLVKLVANLMRGHLVTVFVHKYRIPAWLCNSLLFHIDFDEKVRESLSSETLELIKMIKNGGSRSKNLFESIDREVHHIKCTAENAMSEAKKVVDTMGKLLIEMDTYFQKTVTLGTKFQPSSKPPIILEDMRQELLK